MPTVTLGVEPWTLSVCRLAPTPRGRAPVADAPVHSVTRTPDELSVVCAAGDEPDGCRVEPGWRALRIVGPLAFDLVGVVASVSLPLAEAGVRRLRPLHLRHRPGPGRGPPWPSPGRPTGGPRRHRRLHLTHAADGRHGPFGRKQTPTMPRNRDRDRHRRHQGVPSHVIHRFSTNMGPGRAVDYRGGNPATLRLPSRGDHPEAVDPVGSCPTPRPPPGRSRHAPSRRVARNDI